MRLLLFYTILFFAFAVIFCIVQPSIAQVPEDAEYSKEEVYKKPFDNGKWKSLKKDLDYTEKEPELDQDQPRRSFSAPFTIDSIFIKSFLFVAAAVVLIIILFKIFNKSWITNVKIPKTDYTLETIEEDIHEADLEAFLNEAIKIKNYKQIIRIYYLIVIRELSDKNVITWKKDKTNNQYLQEMAQAGDFKIFKELTNYFEYIWYSKISFSEDQYITVSDRFKGYIEKLKGRTTNI